MKDLISYLLDVNISVLSNSTKKKLFDCVIKDINYY